ncbi:hypothetical protein [Companilactobacillus metriopterae]|uniref:hypothetical protein n=1 Tax=Companilactobacillus metriopterae TaxID=1909267 RepID=UPI00100BF4D5|nr:hypothetical protein [Companilactobacillus metriopterae]
MLRKTKKRIDELHTENEELKELLVKKQNRLGAVNEFFYEISKYAETNELMITGGSLHTDPIVLNISSIKALVKIFDVDFIKKLIDKNIITTNKYTIEYYNSHDGLKLMVESIGKEFVNDKK